MLRIAQRTQARIGYAFTDADGAPVEPADVNVTVTDANGDVIVGGGAAVNDDSMFVYKFASPHTDTLGVLRAAWQAEIDGVEQTFETWHEVVGQHVTTLADLRRLEPLDDTMKYPAWLVEHGRDLATYALEDVCNTAFARRVTSTYIAELGAYPVIDHVRDVTLTAIDHGTPTSTVDLTADPNLYGFRVGRGGLVVGGALRLNAPVTVRYEHGYRSAPPRVARAVALLAREWLQENVDEAIPQRAISVDSDAGTMRLVTAGEFGRAFDIPEVNAVVQRYGE